MKSNGRNDDDPTPTKRGTLIREYLSEHGISDVEDAPDELFYAANAYADSFLGVGKDN